MRKYWIMSDLHFEFHRDGGDKFLADLPEPEYDAVLLSGDLCDNRRLERSLEKVSARFKEVYYVIGNHECYRSWIHVTLQTARAVAERLGNIYVLEAEARNGVRGTTLWFPYPAGAPLSAEWGMNDFNRIKDFRKTVGDYNKNARTFLCGTNPEDVVLTHYLPGVSSVAKKYMGHVLNHFFIGQVEDVLTATQPRLWVHGHTHESCDYKIGNTRVVCNPYGYHEADVNPNFIPDLVVEA